MNIELNIYFKEKTRWSDEIDFLGLIRWYRGELKIRIILLLRGYIMRYIFKWKRNINFELDIGGRN